MQIMTLPTTDPVAEFFAYARAGNRAEHIAAYAFAKARGYPSEKREFWELITKGMVGR